MNKTFGLLFYVKRSKMISNGTVPVYLRVTVDGERIEISSKRYVNPDKWNANAQKLNGSSEEVRTMNCYLASFFGGSDFKKLKLAFPPGKRSADVKGVGIKIKAATRLEIGAFHKKTIFTFSR